MGRLVRRAQRVYYGWYLAGASVVIGFFGALNNYGFGVLFLPLTKDLNLTRAQTSLVFSTARLEGGIEGPLAGLLTDKLGPRTMLIVGNTLAGLGFILLGTVVHGFGTLFVVWVFVASVGFQAGFYTSLITAMNTWFVRYRSTALSIVSSSNRIGGFLWTPLLAYLVVSQGWRTASVIAGITILAVTVPLSLLFHRSPESIGLRPDGATEEQAASAATAHRRRLRAASHDFTVKEALRTRTFWVFTAAQFCRMMSFGAIAVHMIPMLVWKGQSEQGAAFMASLVPLIGIPMTLVYGQLGDRLNPKHLLAFATLLSTTGLVLLTFTGQLWVLYVFVLMHGVGEAVTPLIPTLVGEYFGRRSFATLRGVQNFITVIGPFVAPVYAGWVYDRTQSYVWALIPFFVVRAVAIPLYLVLTHPRPPARARSPGARRGLPV